MWIAARPISEVPITTCACPISHKRERKREKKRRRRRVLLDSYVCMYKIDEPIVSSMYIFARIEIDLLVYLQRRDETIRYDTIEDCSWSGFALVPCYF